MSSQVKTISIFIFCYALEEQMHWCCVWRANRRQGTGVKQHLRDHILLTQYHCSATGQIYLFL